jgi:hypothetical protein
LREEVVHMRPRRHREARRDRVDGGVRYDLGRVDIQLAAPDQPGRLALFHDGVEEAAKDLQPIALADLAQTGMVRQRLVQVTD